MNLTHVVRDGRYFMWRLLRLTELYNSGGSKNQNRTVGLDREFHAYLLFRKWATDHELLHEGEVLSAPCYTAIQRTAQRHYLSDASFEAVGGFCVESKVFWRYGLPKELTAELKRTGDRRETCPITINLLEVLGMVMTAWVMLVVVGDRADAKGDPILLVVLMNMTVMSYLI